MKTNVKTKSIKIILLLLIALLSLSMLSSCGYIKDFISNPQAEVYSVNGFAVRVVQIGDDGEKQLYEAHIIGEAPRDIPLPEIEGMVIAIPSELKFKIRESLDKEEGVYPVVSVSGISNPNATVDLNALDESVNINLVNQVVQYNGLTFNMVSSAADASQAGEADLTSESDSDKDDSIYKVVDAASCFEFSSIYDAESHAPQVPATIFSKPVVLSEEYKNQIRQGINDSISLEEMTADDYLLALENIDTQLAFIGETDNSLVEELNTIRTDIETTHEELLAIEREANAEQNLRDALNNGEALYYDGPWVEVNLTTQQVTTHVGPDIINTYTVSTGLPDSPTRVGVFRVWYKTKEQTMRGTTSSGGRYETPNVKWNTFFDGDIALHGCYWHDNYGQPMSQGCVNMREPEAKEIYDFAPIGTLVVVHY